MLPRCTNPGDIRLLSIEIAGDGVNEYVKSGFFPETTGLFDGEDSLDPAVPLLTGCPLHHLAPEHPKAQGSLRSVVGGLDTLLDKKEPQFAHQPFQMTSKLPRLVFSVPVPGDQMNQAGIPDARLTLGWWSVCPGNQSLKLGENPLTKLGQIRVLPCHQPLCPAEQVGQAGLLPVDPVAVYPIAVTDQNSSPFVDQGFESFLGAAGENFEEGDVGTGHYPKPHQNPVLIPRGLVNIIDLGPAGSLSNGLIQRFNGFRGPVDGSLDGSSANGDAKNRPAKCLNTTATVSMGAGHVGNKSGEPWAIPTLMFFGNTGLDEPAASGADSLMQNEMSDLHLNRRKLGFLVGVVRRGNRKIGVAALALPWFHGNHFLRRKKSLMIAFMTFPCSRFAFCSFLQGSLFIRAVRGRRAIRVPGVLIQPCAKFFNLLFQTCILGKQGAREKEKRDGYPLPKSWGLQVNG